MSVASDGELKFEICLCVRDDVMMYGHASGARHPSASQHASTSLTGPTIMPHIYHSVDLVDMLTSSANFDSAQLWKRLPKVYSTIKDRFCVMSYVSPILLSFHKVSSLFDSGHEYDLSNILVVVNATSEVQMESVHQEFEDFKHNCLIQ